jgi:hypothetical protein
VGVWENHPLEGFCQEALLLPDATFDDCFPHSPELRGGGCYCSAKTSRGEDLQVEHPVCCRDSPAFYFYATLPRVLGPTLIRDEVVQMRESRQKRLLAPA